MLIVINDMKLEITDGSHVYFDSGPLANDLYKPWDRLDENVREGLKKILDTAEQLLMRGEDLLKRSVGEE
jgi:hypothetical protein